MPIKIRVKAGEVEIEYEGPEELLKQVLPDIIKEIPGLIKQSPSPATVKSPTEMQATTASLAARFQAKSGTDLIMAAAAHLSLVKKKESFSREELLDQMKSASQFYKPTYSNNLSKYIKTLIKDGKLNEPSTNQYTLTPSAVTTWSAQIAGS